MENNETAGIFLDAFPVAAGGGVMSRKVSSSLVVAVTIKNTREPRMDASAAAANFFIFQNLAYGLYIVIYYIAVIGISSPLFYAMSQKSSAERHPERN